MHTGEAVGYIVSQLVGGIAGPIRILARLVLKRAQAVAHHRTPRSRSGLGERPVPELRLPSLRRGAWSDSPGMYCMTRYGRPSDSWTPWTVTIWSNLLLRKLPNCT